MRRAARIDDNQPEIVDALRRAGVSVEIVGKPVDLLLWSPKNGLMLMEVKNPDGGRLTKDQVEFIARWPGPVPVVETIEEAVQAAIGPY